MIIEDGAGPPAEMEPAGLNEPDQPDPSDAPDELALARELILRAHPDAIQELITGTTLSEMLASIPAAEAAFERVAATIRDATGNHPSTSTSVPGGGAVRTSSINLDGLGPLAKIRAGLGQG